VVALSPDQLAQLMLEERKDAPPCALLIARASEPVLPPELGEATERAAEVVYIVNLPLEGDTP
jgi:DNA-binding transcriptional regulator YdaS (Cro superfamily)